MAPRPWGGLGPKRCAPDPHSTRKIPDSTAGRDPSSSWSLWRTRSIARPCRWPGDTRLVGFQQSLYGMRDGFLWHCWPTSRSFNHATGATGSVVEGFHMSRGRRRRSWFLVQESAGSVFGLIVITVQGSRPRCSCFAAPCPIPTSTFLISSSSLPCWLKTAEINWACGRIDRLTSKLLLTAVDVQRKVDAEHPQKNGDIPMCPPSVKSRGSCPVTQERPG